MTTIGDCLENMGTAPDILKHAAIVEGRDC
jgi:hypothetical protein